MDRDEMKRPRTNDERISYKDGSDGERDIPAAPEEESKGDSGMENTRRSLEDIIKDATERELDSFPKAELTPEALLAMERRHDSRKKKKILRIASIAAMFIIIAAGAVFVTGGYFDAGADKNPKEEIVTDDGIVSRDGGYGDQGGEDEFVITEWDEIADYYSEQFPEIMLPNYCPKGYKFTKLNIQDEQKTMTFRFVFKNEEESLEIHEYFYDGSLGSVEISDYKKMLVSDKGKIYLQDIDNNIKATTQIDSGAVIEIWGNLSDDEYIKIINNLKTN